MMNPQTQTQPAHDAASWRNPQLRDALCKKCDADINAWWQLQASAPVPESKSSFPQEPLKLYALIDGGQLKSASFDIDAVCGALNLNLIKLYEETADREHADYGPLLVTIPTDNTLNTHKALRALTQGMVYGWTMMFFTARLRHVLLMEHLDRFRRATLPGEGELLFAYFDPRCFINLLQCAKPVTDAFVKPLTALAYWARSLALTTVKGENAQTIVEKGFMNFSPETIQALTDGAEADRVRNFVLNKGVDLNDFSPHLQYQIVAQLTQRATKHRLHEFETRCDYTRLGLSVTPLLDNIPEFKEAFNDENNPEAAFTQALLNISDATLMHYRNEGNKVLQELRQQFYQYLMK
jgi:hypothetical protein